MREYHIEKITTADRIPELAHVFRTSFRDTYPLFPELHTPEEDLEFFTNVVLAKDEVYIAIDEKLRIAGFIAFNKEFIDHLYLLPEAQHEGLGSKLIRIAFAHSDELKLWTFQENTGARSLYQKHGFIAIKETDGADNEEKQPDILFWRKNPA